MTSPDQSYLRFSLEESIWFPAGKEINELYSLAIEPEVTIAEMNGYVSIKGYLQVTGDYRGFQQRAEEEKTWEDNARLPGHVHKIDYNDEEEILCFSHQFPVDISVPSSRVEEREEIEIDISSFDYHMPESTCIKLIADLSITGIYAGIVSREEGITPVEAPDFLQKEEDAEAEEHIPIEVDESLEATAYARPSEESQKGEPHEFDVSNPQQTLFSPFSIPLPTFQYQEPMEQQRINSVQEVSDHLFTEVLMPDFVPEAQETEPAAREENVNPQATEEAISTLQPASQGRISSPDEDVYPNAWTENPDSKESEGTTEEMPSSESNMDESETSVFESFKPVRMNQEESTVSVGQKDQFTERQPEESAYPEQKDLPEQPLMDAGSSYPDESETSIFESVKHDGRSPAPVHEDTTYERKMQVAMEPETYINDAKQESSSSSNKKPVSLVDFFASKDGSTHTKLKVCIIQQGETIQEVAERYAISTHELLFSNKLEDERDLSEGQVLYIPRTVSNK
ncbi:MAG: LysM peptidoglycan-binding domain-containing protein [Bacillus sp. (in: firmicutes)]